MTHHRTLSLAILLVTASVLLAADPALTQRVRHPGGVTARCPADWKVEAAGPLLQLTPPNPNPLGDPPVYKLIVADAGGVSGPDDPQLLAALEQQATAQTPYMKRVGAIESVTVGTAKGSVLTYEGKSPAGLVERGRLHVAVLGDRLVLLTARSSRFNLRKHEPVLSAIFATLEREGGAPAAAPAGGFAGTFRNDKITILLETRRDGVTGRIEFGGKAFPLSGRVSGQSLSGTFKSGTSEFEFTATLSGNRLTLVTGGATHELTREGGGAPEQANPLGEPSGATPPTPAASPADPAAVGRLGAPRPDPGREWTVVVYLDGDNDLEPFAVRDLVEMEFGLPQKGVEVIVLLDRAAGFDGSAGDWTDARVYRVRPDRNPDRIASELLAQPGEVNMGDPRVLAAFLGGALRTFPARNHMLVLWDHGGGWAAMASDLAAPGATGGHDKLTLPELREGIRGGLDAAGLKTLDLIGFDMCLMAQIEVASELQGLAEVMVASQAIEPGAGWPYNELLPILGKGTLGARRIAQEIVRAYSRFYDERDEPVATLSALDLTLLPQVNQALDGLLVKLQPAIAPGWAGLSRSIFYSEAYAERTDIRNGQKALASVDLLDMVKRMRYATQPFPAEEEFRGLVNAADRFVLASHTSRRRRLSNGLAIYAPVHGEMFDPSYAGTRFGSSSAWPGFLARVHALQTANASPPKFSDMRISDDRGNPIPAVEAQMNHRISFTLTGKNLVWTQVWLGKDEPAANGTIVLAKSFVVDPGFYTRRKEAVADVVDLIMPQYVDGANRLYADESGLQLKVTDGQRAYLATMDFSALDDLDNIRVPVVVRHPSLGKVGATIFFDAYWWQAKGVLAEIIQPDGRMMYRQVRLPEDADVTLLFETVGADGKIGYAPGATVKWGKGLELLLDERAPGEYRAAFIAETISGARSVESIKYPVKKSDWVDGARKAMSEFKTEQMVGVWDHYLVGQEFKATGLVFNIAAHPKDKDLLVAEVTSTKRSNVKISQVLWPDSRLLPSLRIFEYDDKGKLIGWYLATCTFGVRDGKPTLLYKMADVTRTSAALVKREAAGVAQGGGTPQQQPAAATSIVGTWSSNMGIVMVCDASRYAFYVDGELDDQGSYTIRGNQIVVTNADGENEHFTFQISGGVLTMVDQYGQRVTFSRVK